MSEEGGQGPEPPVLDPDAAKVLARLERIVARGKRRFWVKIAIPFAIWAIAPVFFLAWESYYGSATWPELAGVSLCVALLIGLSVLVSNWQWKRTQRTIAEIRAGERVGRPRDLRESHAILFIGYGLGFGAAIYSVLVPRSILPLATMLSIAGMVLAGWGATKITHFHFRLDASARCRKYVGAVVPWYVAWLYVILVVLIVAEGWLFAALRLASDWLP